MSQGSVPSPDFDESRYDRPNKKWLCGHTCDGCPCRIGPSPQGECRATTECQPQLVTPPGETKGTWKCTRPKDAGGTCEHGPHPDGTCCKTIAKCSPVPSLRARRGRLTRAVVIACAGLLLIGLGGSLRETFINPAPLSPNHQGPEFTRLVAQHAKIDLKDAGQGCVGCHAEIAIDGADVVASAAAAHHASLSPDKFLTPHPKDFSRMDASCATCHTAQTFHQPNVARDTACSVCHREHQGPGALPAVADAHCADCHGNAEQMNLAASQARVLPHALFTKASAPGIVLHPSSRPAEGFTRRIHSFATDHPEFQVLREKQTDPNPLKFNHALHLAGGSVPLLHGKPLDCASCHQPDASGAFMQRVNFEQNCRSCHSLDFDETAPGLQLPHGDAVYVRAFLRSLPTHYADYARAKIGLTSEASIATYVKGQMQGLRERTLSGENLERALFFADAQTGEATVIAGVKGVARARFAGCAYCHEVTPQGDAAPLITLPKTPDRWLQHARFNHAKHSTMACTECHAADGSTRTADVILPNRQSCVTCHSPAGGVSDSCVTCHGYHNPRPASLPAALKTTAPKP